MIIYYYIWWRRKTEAIILDTTLYYKFIEQPNKPKKKWKQNRKWYTYTPKWKYQG